MGTIYSSEPAPDGMSRKYAKKQLPFSDEKEFFKACFLGDRPKVDTLLKEYGPLVLLKRFDPEKHRIGFIYSSTRPSAKPNCLHIASFHGNVELLEFLLRKATQILLEQTKYVDREKFREFINQLDDYGGLGWTPLMAMAFSGSLACIHVILDEQYRSSVYFEVKGGEHARTALMLAAQQGFYDIVRLLVENGAFVSETDGLGKTLIDMTEDETVKKYLQSLPWFRQSPCLV